MSYHNGSIWPHDNALIALGLRPLRPRSDRSSACSRACSTPRPTWTCAGCPSCSAASSAAAARGPTLYPVACSPQAWASATPFTLLEASLGLEFDPAANEIRLRNRACPSFLDEVVLRNLQLKQSSVDLKVRRHANEVSVEILERRGESRSRSCSAGRPIRPKPDHRRHASI